MLENKTMATNNNFDIIPQDIIDIINACDPVTYGVLSSEDGKTIAITTNFLDTRNDLIDVLLWKVNDDIFLSDDFLINNEFTLFFDEKKDNDIFKSIHNSTIGFPITQYFTDDPIFKIAGKQLICKTNIKDLKQDYFYFCQSIITHMIVIHSILNTQP